MQINQQSLAELLTFIDFADTQLTIGFVAVNFTEDRNTLIEILGNHARCNEIQFEILNFADPNLRFLRDEIIHDLKEIHLKPDKKLVLIVIGLEKSIGLSGEYPPVLQDLNFVRDAFRIGNVRGKAMTLWWLGHLAEQQGEYTKAISYLQPALDILQRLKSPKAENVSASLARVQQKVESEED
ncbi:tetratricopeptide repeat protein [Nostoc sp.]|uniref:tetratricopeptide repeat protein n=1 Tax=Nostoc sp. TaxID=1180 RepID=UPI002FFAD733